jgi:hypothetical protein
VSLSSGLIDLALAIGAVASSGAALLWWHRRRSAFHAWWPSGTSRIIASDTGVAPARTIRDCSNGLYGRPDYLLAQGHGEAPLIIPFELKPQRRSRRLYESDAVQLGVYLLATRASYGARAAPFGFVQYAGAEFCVELTKSLESRVLEIAAAIRAGREATVVHRSHHMPARCAGCPVRLHCDESLV